MRSTDYDDYDYAQFIKDEAVVEHQRERDIQDDYAFDAMREEEDIRRAE